MDSTDNPIGRQVRDWRARTRKRNDDSGGDGSPRPSVPRAVPWPRCPRSPVSCLQRAQVLAMRDRS